MPSIDLTQYSVPRVCGALILCAALTACGGGGSGSSSPIISPPPAPVDTTAPVISLEGDSVMTVEQAEKAAAAGVKFVVTPGFDDDVVDWCIANDMPVTPGVVTPTEINMALKKGLDVVKFFPAEEGAAEEFDHWNPQAARVCLLDCSNGDDLRGPLRPAFPPLFSAVVFVSFLNAD